MVWSSLSFEQRRQFLGNCMYYLSAQCETWGNLERQKSMNEELVHLSRSSFVKFAWIYMNLGNTAYLGIVRDDVKGCVAPAKHRDCTESNRCWWHHQIRYPAERQRQCRKCGYRSKTNCVACRALAHEVAAGYLHRYCWFKLKFLYSMGLFVYLLYIGCNWIVQFWV